MNIKRMFGKSFIYIEGLSNMRMDFEIRAIKMGSSSVGMTLPIDLVRYLGIEVGDVIGVREETGKKGTYCSFWKKTSNQNAVDTQSVKE